MSTVKLAWRNLLRNRRRTIATLGTMVVGVTALLLFGGYNRTVEYGLQTSMVRADGHLEIQQRDYFNYGDGNPAAYAIRDYQRVMRTVANDPVLKPMLTVVTPSLSLGGIAGHYAAGASRTVFASGVDVAGQNQLRQWNDYHFEDKSKPSALTGTSQDSVVIGKGLARVLQLCESGKEADCAGRPAAATDKNKPDMPADIQALADAAPKPVADRSLELLAASAGGAPNVAKLQVAKVKSMGVKQLDDMFISMHLAAAQKLVYGAEPPRVTAISLQLRHTSQIPAAKARLNQLFAASLKDQPLVVYDFTQLQPQYGQITGMFGTIFGFLSVLIGCVALFTIANTMNMVVLERTVEIGTLRAMGLRRRGIQRMFLCEGVMLGVAGSALGVLSGLIFAWLINHAGLTWLPPGQVDPSPIYVSLWGEGRLIGNTVLGLGLMAAVSAWWPARRAARAVIVDALRHA
ncbi:ABC transporter permease [Chromobacterium sp. IIBBL 290-4]|uniref:ABC transporter permease n=1 Tax=Chromobacterium sp. IIBBL 290-4 TaxID=2953890 RepID=UPI0020B6580D|nr:FtsX-like permease family protein [Chromobacterium sp. IIBBL 290-4]UTH72883.1 FtsX-like permease family protein [Chromobacterium sp. IIBBL 290-4]